MTKEKDIETMLKNLEGDVARANFSSANITIQLLELARLSEEQKAEVDRLAFIMKEAQRNAQQVLCPA